MIDLLERIENEPGVIVGLDPHLGKLPADCDPNEDPRAALVRWSCGALEAMAPHVCAVKPQVALYEQHGADGVAALVEVCAFARSLGVPVLLDAKRGDIGSTAEAYARATLDDDGPIKADAVTLSPYLGPESLAPFLKRAEQGKQLFVLLRTSNPGAERWQAAIAPSIADWVREQNARLGAPRIGVVIGATIQEHWRDRLPRAWFLMPGIGAQGASVDDIAHQRRADGGGVLPTASRSILFGGDGPEWQRGIAERAAGFAATWTSCYHDA